MSPTQEFSHFLKDGKQHLPLAILTITIFLLSTIAAPNIGTAHATGSTPVNVVANSSFEAGVDPNGTPIGWDFTNCEGVGNATTTQDTTQWVDGNNSTRIDTAPVTSALCIAPNVRQSATCADTLQQALICSFTYPLSNSSLVAFCMGMSGTGNTFTVSDTLGHSFSIQQEVNTNVHVACGYSTNYTQLAYQQSGKDNVTLNFQANALNDSGAVYEVLGAGPANDGGPCAGTGTGTSFACNTSVTVAGYPLILSMVVATTAMTNYIPATHFVATPISPTANVQYENSSLITITRCQSSNDNTVDYGMVCLFMGLKRFIGFSQFSQKINPTYNFTDLTDSPSGFSFWFRLEPYNTNPMAGFEVRIFGGETQAELQYIFNPDPSVGQYSNITSGYYTYSLLFYGYKPGQWYHFSRNLRADWINLGIPVTTSFNGIQFEGFSTLSGNTVKSETIWIDDVRAYAYGTGPIPSPTSWTNFSFLDSAGNLAGNTVQWRLTDHQGQTVTYTLGQSSLPPGPYYLQAYYRTTQPGYLIHQQQIHLNSTLSIPLPLFPNPAGTYIALNDSSITTTTTQLNSTALHITATGPVGRYYRMLVDLPRQPLAVQENGVDLQQGRDWTYDSSSELANISFDMRTSSEDFTVNYATPAPIQDNTLITVLLSIVAIAVIVTVGAVVWRRRGRSKQSVEGPKQTVAKQTSPNKNKQRKDRNKRR